MHVYKRAEGIWVWPNEEVSIGLYSGGGSQGLSQYRNNPTVDHIENLGPLPAGVYTIGQPENLEVLGVIVFKLTPDLTNDMHGRSGFYVHGDNRWMNYTASDGCIIMKREDRLRLASEIATNNKLLVE